ncbi:hypothetical protein [Lacipirellula parvula]|uniref:Uncharacterized protein n=1 Tax=Lacipirellula parvula TaxID=2650471 RepID=A0A5K7X827_9BACT|nr:hypothetical protein [Lacipirellula parvula]BBO30603.1 hypothetical protein PLANPX_0215 [Lacipirellula parvula]
MLRAVNNHRSRRLLLAFLALSILATAAADSIAQCYDATIGRQLADVPGSVPVEVVYHAYPWTPAKYEVEALGHRGKIVALDYEPTVLAGDRRQPLDPREASLHDIAKAHRELHDALEAIRPQAKREKTRIGIYSWFEHTPANGDFILTHPQEYFDNVQATARLQVAPGETIRDQLKDLGGVNWTSNYVPEGWNNDTWGLQKFLITCERKAAALEAAGVPSVPQLRPVTVGKDGEKPVREAIVRAWVLWARNRYGNQWAIWAKEGEVTPEFKSWLK